MNANTGKKTIQYKIRHDKSYKKSWVSDKTTKVALHGVCLYCSTGRHF